MVCSSSEGFRWVVCGGGMWWEWDGGSVEERRRKETNDTQQ